MAKFLIKFERSEVLVSAAHSAEQKEEGVRAKKLVTCGT